MQKAVRKAVCSIIYQSEFAENSVTADIILFIFRHFRGRYSFGKRFEELRFLSSDEEEIMSALSYRLGNKLESHVDEDIISKKIKKYDHDPIPFPPLVIDTAFTIFVHGTSVIVDLDKVPHVEKTKTILRKYEKVERLSENKFWVYFEDSYHVIIFISRVSNYIGEDIFNHGKVNYYHPLSCENKEADFKKWLIENGKAIFEEGFCFTYKKWMVEDETIKNIINQIFRYHLGETIAKFNSDGSQISIKFNSDTDALKFNNALSFRLGNLFDKMTYCRMEYVVAITGTDRHEHDPVPFNPIPDHVGIFCSIDSNSVLLNLDRKFDYLAETEKNVCSHEVVSPTKIWLHFHTREHMIRFIEKEFSRGERRIGALDINPYHVNN